MNYVVAADAERFLGALRDESVDLFLIDPPYFGILNVPWDNQWESAADYASWLVRLCKLAKRKVKRSGSLVMFQAMGKHRQHPIFQVVTGVEEDWCFRNWITWKKSRAFGKSSNYLYCRDEILWFTASEREDDFTFNTPFLNEKPKRAGKTEFKKVTNVWDDVEQVFRPCPLVPTTDASACSSHQGAQQPGRSSRGLFRRLRHDGHRRPQPGKTLPRLRTD